MSQLEQPEEYQLAIKENRQPNCVYCERPLDEIIQNQVVSIIWTWNTETKSYDKDDTGGDSDKAECGDCGARSWDFVDENLVHF